MGINPTLYTNGDQKPHLKTYDLQLIKLNTAKPLKGKFGWSCPLQKIKQDMVIPYFIKNENVK